MAEEISLHKLLNDEPSRPGLVELYQRTMLHRTNEALNGLSNRLDKIINTAEESGKAQIKQQRAMIALTTVLAIATVAYTGITIWSTMKTSQPSAMTSVNETVAVHPVFANKQAAEGALAKAPELIAGSSIRDTAGCLYGVGADGSRLVLVPISVKGVRICAAEK